MVYRGFKDLGRIIASDKILHNKAFNIAKIQNMMDINVDLFQWSLDFLIKKLLVVPRHFQINLLLKMRISLIKNKQMNYTNQVFENLEKEKCTHIL